MEAKVIDFILTPNGCLTVLFMAMCFITFGYVSTRGRGRRERN